MDGTLAPGHNETHSHLNKRHYAGISISLNFAIPPPWTRHSFSKLTVLASEIGSLAYEAFYGLPGIVTCSQGWLLWPSAHTHAISHPTHVTHTHESSSVAQTLQKARSRLRAGDEADLGLPFTAWETLNKIFTSQIQILLPHKMKTSMFTLDSWR